MAARYPLVDFVPGWEVANDNLVELVDLFEGHLEWRPHEGEWCGREVFEHLILARYHGPIPEVADLRRIGRAAANCATASGLKHELAVSWDMLARFLLDETRLNAIYPDGSPEGETPSAPPLMGSVERAAAGFELGYVDRPEAYSGHYIAYHRFAHDLHHRATLVGYLGQRGVSLDGRRIRPL